MDIDIARTAITVISFVAFLGICVWAYSGRQKSRFDEAANLPFADDDIQQRTLAAERAASDSSSVKRNH
jgi:cytochrome c oxidase cbb3-type subunit 4